MSSTDSVKLNNLKMEYLLLKWIFFWLLTVRNLLENCALLHVEFVLIQLPNAEVHSAS